MKTISLDVASVYVVPSVKRSFVNFPWLLQLMNECGVGAVWLSEEKALEVTSDSDSFYFMAAFRGPVFEHLKKLGVKYGSQNFG